MDLLLHSNPSGRHRIYQCTGICSRRIVVPLGPETRLPRLPLPRLPCIAALCAALALFPVHALAAPFTENGGNLVVDSAHRFDVPTDGMTEFNAVTLNVGAYMTFSAGTVPIVWNVAGPVRIDGTLDASGRSIIITTPDRILFNGAMYFKDLILTAVQIGHTGGLVGEGNVTLNQTGRTDPTPGGLDPSLILAVDPHIAQLILGGGTIQTAGGGLNPGLGGLTGGGNITTTGANVGLPGGNITLTGAGAGPSVGGNIVVQPTPRPLPEPGTLTLIGGGLSILVASTRRSRRRSEH